MDAHLSANQAVLDEIYGELLKLVRTLGDDAVNWAPLPRDTNSIAAMVTHTIGSTNGWLSRAVGTPIQRDRDAEFRVRTPVGSLVTQIEDGQAGARGYFQGLAEVDPSTVRRVVRLSSGTSQEVTVAWCVEHAVIHAGEHWGQIQLTAQLYRARLGGGTST